MADVWLDSYFAHYVFTARISHKNPRLSSYPPNYFKMLKEQFIHGLELATQAAIDESGGVTHRHLGDMVKLARNLDWSDAEELKPLFVQYSKIRGDPVLELS